MKSGKEEFKRKTILTLEHLVKIGWIDSYGYTGQRLGYRWTDKGARRAAVLACIDRELNPLGGSADSLEIILNLCEGTATPEAGKKLLDDAK